MRQFEEDFDPNEFVMNLPQQKDWSWYRIHSLFKPTEEDILEYQYGNDIWKYRKGVQK